MRRCELAAPVLPVLPVLAALAALACPTSAARQHTVAPDAAGQAPSEWRTIEPGLALEFPRDHGAHPDTRIEWWYVTGQVADGDGRRFGFELALFRRGRELPPEGAEDAEAESARARQVYAGHLAVTDVAGERTLFAERLRRAGPLAAASERDLDVALEDWTLARRADGRLALDAADPAQRIGLALSLAPAKPLVLHGGDGWSPKGPEPGNASAYVSWTRLAVSGELTVDGAPRAVTGEAWYDHEFGSTVLGDGVVGWDWFGLRLADGRELMLFHLRRQDGGIGEASAGTLVERDGSARALGRADFEIEALARWTNPRTGATWPARWRLRVPSAGIDLEAAPLVADCELVSTASTGVRYWEGPVRLSDAEGRAAGEGYAELTGYAGSMAGRF